MGYSKSARGDKTHDEKYTKRSNQILSLNTEYRKAREDRNLEKIQEIRLNPDYQYIQLAKTIKRRLSKHIKRKERLETANQTTEAIDSAIKRLQNRLLESTK